MLLGMHELSTAQ